MRVNLIIGRGAQFDDLRLEVLQHMDKRCEVRIHSDSAECVSRASNVRNLEETLEWAEQQARTLKQDFETEIRWEDLTRTDRH